MCYPNERAIEMEKLAGYEVIKHYVRNISFVLFGLTLLMPVKVVSRKLILNFKDWFSSDVIRFSRHYHRTAHKVFGFPVLTRAGFRKHSSQPIAGFLYEYVETRDDGDPFISYKGCNVSDTPFGLEYSDNSA